MSSSPILLKMLFLTLPSGVFLLITKLCGSPALFRDTKRKRKPRKRKPEPKRKPGQLRNRGSVSQPSRFACRLKFAFPQCHGRELDIHKESKLGDGYRTHEGRVRKTCLGEQVWKTSKDNLISECHWTNLTITWI